jgi:hypothetical protein
MEDPVAEKQEKTTGEQILRAIEEHIALLDTIDPDDADALSEWQDALVGVIDACPDKMLGYRTFLELNEAKKDFFKKQRDRYARRWRARDRAGKSVKELAHYFLRKYHDMTGSKKMELEDGTWATLSKSAADWVFYDAESGDVDIDPASLPKEYVKIEISRSALKAAAKSKREIPGITYVPVEKTHVRWS